MTRLMTTGRVVVVLALAGLAGCGKAAPRPSDPVAARDLLRQALNSWKAGDAHDAFRQATPNVTVVDRQWQRGVKLLGYEIDGDGRPDGFDVQFAVALSTADAAGKPSRQKIVYNVSTTPAQVIVRSDPGS
jgi:hypothetical protein